MCEEIDRNGNYIGIESYATIPDGEKTKEVVRVNGTSYPDVLLRMASNIIAFEMGLEPVYSRAELIKCG